ncbi:PAS domain-containing hybrid sensor histidine kinase/response regulator [Alteromonas sp. A079]|uniref:PAS domain-containing hybrid sensor histidine kinase/response regulator n=1 Tax=Alteromonas sp. A079 TaxID=3410268 RepID=UPI003BA03D3D
MLSIWTVGTIVGFYLLALFALAFWGDKHLRDNRQHPILYSLGLGVHCTSWAFFGTTSQAAQYGWAVTPTYLGIMLTMAFAFPVILHISRLCQQHNISSLADLISLKYQHSHLIAALITLLCFFGVVPYIALQLDAITKSINLLTGEPQTTTPWLSIYVAGLLAIFAITFGTRTLNLTDKHPGLLLTIAFESLFKLIALWTVGVFVCFFMFDGVLDLVAKASANEAASNVIYADSAPLVYLTHVMLGICSMFVLPRQFHMNFVELNGEGELRTARWLFPMYLLGMTVFLIPLALAGKMLLPDTVNSDTYVLALPIYANNIEVSIIAFLGGLSATTSMVIVATLALGIMIANNVVTPLWIKARLRTEPNHTMQPGKILTIRRLTVLVVLSVALWYHLNVSQAAPLVKSGIIAIALLSQSLPILMFGLYWKKSTKAAAVSGLFAGFTCWCVLLLYPSLMSSYYFNTPPSDAELGIGFVYSLMANSVTFLLVALLTNKSVSPHRASDTKNIDVASQQLMVKVSDLMSLTQRVLDKESHDTLIKQLSVDVSRAHLTGYASHALLNRVEQLLAAQVGGPSARILLGAIANTGSDTLPELVDWVEEASQSFQFNHEVLQSSVQHIEQGISVLDDKLKLLAWNERYVELFYYPRGFLKAGMPISDILDFNAQRGLFGNGDEAPQEIEKRIGHMLKGSRHKYVRKQPDGKVIELNGSPLPGGGYVTTYSDITEYIAIQDALEQSKSKLEARVEQRTEQLRFAKQQADDANESKTKFLAAAGHDLMQPFNAATLFASMLEKKTKGSELSSLSEGVVNSLSNAQTLLSMLLDMTKLESGVLNPQKVTFAIDDVLSSLCKEFSLIAKQKNITLRYIKTSSFTYTDKHLFRRVMQNLLSNAIRYTQTGTVVVGIRRKLKLDSAPKGLPTLHVCVYDTGPGIAPSQQTEIFNEFHQLESPRSSQGIGLGLTIVDRMCKLLGHSITLQSALHKGSCFAITVPKSDKKNNSPIDKSKDNTGEVLDEKASSFLHKKRLLLIENDEQVTCAMKALFEDWGATVVTAMSKKEALAACGMKPDIIIADYHLNFGETGTEVLREIALLPHSPDLRLLITANRNSEIRDTAADMGIAYLPKPIKPSALKRILKQRFS